MPGNATDLVLCVMALLSAYFGYRRGLLNELLNVVRWIIAIPTSLMTFATFMAVRVALLALLVVAGTAALTYAGRYDELFALMSSLDLVAWFIAFRDHVAVRYAVGIVLLVGAIVGGKAAQGLIKSQMEHGAAGGIDRLLGFGFGILRILLVLVIAAMFLRKTQFAEEPWWQQSLLIPHLLVAAERADDRLPELPELEALPWIPGLPGTDGTEDAGQAERVEQTGQPRQSEPTEPVESVDEAAGSNNTRPTDAQTMMRH